MEKYKNEGFVDRLVRLIIAITLAVVSYLFAKGGIQVLLYVVSIIILITSITGFCALYKIFGLNTLPKIKDGDNI